MLYDHRRENCLGLGLTAKLKCVLIFLGKKNSVKLIKNLKVFINVVVNKKSSLSPLVHVADDSEVDDGVE